MTSVDQYQLKNCLGSFAISAKCKQAPFISHVGYTFRNP